MSLDVSIKAYRVVEVFDYNITHNLINMAKAVDLYIPIWRPEELGLDVVHGSNLIPYLEFGITKLIERKEELQLLNAKNGWGTYDQFFDFVQAYLKACKENFDGIIEVSR